MGNTDWVAAWPKIWIATLQTLQMVSVSMLIASVFGVLLGLLLYATRQGNLLANAWVSGIFNLLINVIRPIPFIIFIVAITPLTRLVVGTSIGPGAAIFALSIIATLSIGRIVENNLVAVDPGVIEAGAAMGARPLRVLFTILLPEALAPLILGLTYILVALIDFTAVAGVVGGGGLGDLALVYGYQRYDNGIMLIVIIVLIVLVQIVQFVGNRTANWVLRRS